MSKTIWKYVLKITDEQDLEMPMRAEILTCQVQHENVVMWALVDPSVPLIKRRIRIVGTGHEFLNSDKYTFLGSVQSHGGSLVWHVFEQIQG